MRVSSRKQQLTPEDRLLSEKLSTLSDIEKRSWRESQTRTYQVGDLVKVVMGGYTGPWEYGTVKTVKDAYVIITSIRDNSETVALPGPCSGLTHVSREEFDAAKAQRWLN